MKSTPMRQTLYITLTYMLILLLAGINMACSDEDDDLTAGEENDPPAETGEVRNFVYQLTNYPDGKLDALAEAEQDLAVIDLARDGGKGYFTKEEIETLHNSGKKVLAYFSMGTNETYRPEYEAVVEAGLQLNHWPDWPDEYFVNTGSRPGGNWP